ncbi:MAG TPA: DEAD/DEAH box helicase, partial [Candidatus Limiplasma sp.]|nr:DEAD/DEAH box helicase [Candidatus Limiplasma sp.]
KPDSERKPRALILTPTRELAIQIQENFQLYGKHLPLRSCVIFGGVSQYGQVSELRRNPQILVATPGRLNDLIGQGYIKLDHVGIFVLDEADRMLDMGFIQDVKRIIAQLPAKRQTLLFSATMPSEVETLAMSILNQPETVKVDPVSSTVDSIHQVLYMVDKSNKKFLLADLLKKPEVENALVFTRTKHGADRVVKELAGMGVQAMAIHGDKSQNARQAAMGSFKSGELKVLVATDIAARGIDVIGLSHVFNYDLPNEPEAYIHRIGRTGRAGLPGDAISFCCIDEMKDLYAIEKLIGRKIPRVESAWPMQVFTETVKAPRAPRPARVKDVDRRGNAVVPRTQSADHRTPRTHTASAQARTTAGSSAVPQRTAPARKNTADTHTVPQRDTEPRRQAVSSRPADARRQN